MLKVFLAAVAALMVCASPTGSLPAGPSADPVQAKVWHPLMAQARAATKTLSGVASWYGLPFHGRLTANGERYDMNALTAAHRTLPFGTLVRVINIANNVQTIVRINDRGPYVGNRLIDLSQGAARAVHMVGTGITQVKLEILG